MSRSELRRRPSFSSSSSSIASGFAAERERDQGRGPLNVSDAGFGSSNAYDFDVGPASHPGGNYRESAYSPSPSPLTVGSSVSPGPSVLSTRSAYSTATATSTLPAPSPMKAARRPPPAVPTLGPPLVAPSSSSSSRCQQNKVLAEKHHSDGYKLRREGDFEGALIEYTKAIQADNRHFKALFNRGFALDKLGKSLSIICLLSSCCLFEQLIILSLCRH